MCYEPCNVLLSLGELLQGFLLSKGTFKIVNLHSWNIINQAKKNKMEDLTKKIEHLEKQVEQLKKEVEELNKTIDEKIEKSRQQIYKDMNFVGVQNKK